MKMRWTKVALHSVKSDVSDFRDRTVSFKVGVGGGATRSGYGGGVTSSREMFPFLVTNNVSRAAKCVKSCQSIPMI